MLAIAKFLVYYIMFAECVQTSSNMPVHWCIGVRKSLHKIRLKSWAAGWPRWTSLKTVIKIAAMCVQISLAINLESLFFSTGVDLFINPFCKQVVYNSSVSGHSTQLIKADLHTGSVMVEQELRKVLPITKYSPY